LSCGLALWQWLGGAKISAAPKKSRHRKILRRPVSILKPLKGCDDTTRASLASWFKQNYAGPVEILFGVADAQDPVCEIVRELLAENPACQRAARHLRQNRTGMNAKAAKLAQLEKLAQHDLILISDADVRVPPDFLASFVAPLRDEKTGW
jgi:ceramide glucosyltransferase